MRWFRRRLRWEETATRQVPSVYPGSAGHGVVANRRAEVDGVEVLGLDGRGIAINPDTQLPYVGVVASMMAVELSRPLLPFLVSNDLFEAVGKLSPAPPVQVDLPADEDPYDGRTWRVHCVDEAMATALLDPTVWDWLEREGRRSALTLWIDGRHVVASQPMSRADRVARRLVGFHRLVERRLASGELDAWAVDPPYPEVTNHSVGEFDPQYVRDGGWSFTPVERELLFFLWKIRPASIGACSVARSTAPASWASTRRAWPTW